MSGIQGFPLEVTVVACYNLDDKEWISRQDPYVCVEYGSTKFRTKTCRDGGKNPTFQERFTFTLIEGLREVSVMVWDSNTLTADEFIGSGRIQLHKALSQGFDDNTWSLQSCNGRHSGEVRVILHYSTAAAGGGGGSGNGKQQVMKNKMNHNINMPYASFPTPLMAPYTAPSPYTSYPVPSPYYPQSYTSVSAYSTLPPHPYPPQAQAHPHPSSYYPPASSPGFYPPSPY